MAYINQLQMLHWSVWVAVGITFALAGLLIVTLHRFRQPRIRVSSHLKRAVGSASAEKSTKILISDAECTRAPVSGQVLECSMSEVSLLVANSLNKGTILSWRPADSPATFGWATVEVKGSTMDGRYWKLACRFMRTPPWVTRFLKAAPVSPSPPTTV
jgi:hypothetical protein